MDKRKEIKDKKEMVRNPAHYQGATLEAIDVIDDFQLNFNLGNSTKYILRCGKKDPYKSVEDLEKAIWYLKREICRVDKLRKEAISSLFYDDGVIYDENGSQTDWIDVNEGE